MPSIYFSEFFDGSTWERIIADGWSGMVDRFIESYPVLFDARSSSPVPSISAKLIDNIGIKEGMTSLGENKDEYLNLDKILFKKELISLMSEYNYLDQLTFFKLVHVVYEKLLKNYSNKNTIFYHIHNPDTYAKLNFIKSSPDSKWIMMVRDPIQSCESWSSSYFIENKYKEILMGITTMLFDVDEGSS